MPHHKCSYVNCSSTSDSSSMFRFPINDPKRLKLWLTNCGNMTITHLAPIFLKSRYICINHFNTKYISRGDGQRKRLKKTAVPEPCMTQAQAHDSSSPSLTGSPELTVLKPVKCYENKMRCTTEILQNKENIEICHWSTPKRTKIEYTPKCQKLKNSLSAIKKKLTLQIKKNKRLNTKINKNFKSDDYINISNYKFKSDTSKIITTMQFRKTKKRWSTDEKNFCMSLYYI